MCSVKPAPISLPRNKFHARHHRHAHHRRLLAAQQAYDPRYYPLVDANPEPGAPMRPPTGSPARALRRKTTGRCRATWTQMWW
jgi:hypothetical protein